MLKIALITEGYRDQVALETILLGLCQALDEEPEFQYWQPNLDETQRNGQAAPGGWTLLLQALREEEVQAALDYNDYVVVQVDTDICDHKGFDIPRHDGEGAKTTPALIAAVKDKLVHEMALGDEVAELCPRIFLAVAVNAIECWLMPLFYPDQKSKRSKETGCLQAANDYLRKKGRPLLKAPGDLGAEAYIQAFKGFKKRKTLEVAAEHCLSLGDFIAQLDPLKAGQSHL